MGPIKIIQCCRQHCRLSICCYFGWVWQILNTNTKSEKRRLVSIQLCNWVKPVLISKFKQELLQYPAPLSNILSPSLMSDKICLCAVNKLFIYVVLWNKSILMIQYSLFGSAGKSGVLCGKPGARIVTRQIECRHHCVTHHILVLTQKY